MDPDCSLNDQAIAQTDENEASSTGGEYNSVLTLLLFTAFIVCETYLLVLLERGTLPLCK